jgi:hypothetical protein
MKKQINKKIERKSPGTTALIAAIGGLLGFNGLGHIYLGEIGLGLILMIIGWILGIGGLFLTLSIVGAVIGIPMLIVDFILWIWQIYDAYNRAKLLFSSK